MNNTKKKIIFALIPMAQMPRAEVRKPVLPKPSQMYQGKAKNGTISPRKAQ